MGKSKVPFKTNVDQSIRKPAAAPSSMPRQNPITKGGIWIRSKKDRRIKASVVNEKKEKANFIKWILTWVVAIPLGVYALVWLLILMMDLFAG